MANSEPLQKDFEEVARAAESGHGSCASTEAALNKADHDFAALPASVDAGLRRRLGEGLSKLRADALELCLQPVAQATTATTAPRTTTTAPTQPSTTPTTPATTNTQTTPNTTTTTAPGGGTPATEGEGEERRRRWWRAGWRARRQMNATEIGGRYRLEGRLGFGGMSTVHRAFDQRLERQVAVKLLAEHLADDPTFVSRFKREAQAAARLVHPNIVQVFDSGQDELTGKYFIVMEYIEGSSCA